MRARAVKRGLARGRRPRAAKRWRGSGRKLLRDRTYIEGSSLQRVLEERHSRGKLMMMAIGSH